MTSTAMSPGRTARTSFVVRSTTGVAAGAASIRLTPAAIAAASAAALLDSNAHTPNGGSAASAGGVVRFAPTTTSSRVKPCRASAAANSSEHALTSSGRER